MCGCRKITHSPTYNKNKVSNQFPDSKADCGIPNLGIRIRVTEVAHLSGVSSFLNTITIYNLGALEIKSALVNIIAEERIDLTDYEYSKRNNGSIIYSLKNQIGYDPEVDSMIISIVSKSGSHHCIKNIYS